MSQVKIVDSDSALVETLEIFGIPAEDTYELIDGFDSPFPPAIRSGKVLRKGDTQLQINLSKAVLYLCESEDDFAKWEVLVREK